MFTLKLSVPSPYFRMEHWKTQHFGEGLFNKVVCGACGPCHGILCVLFTDMVALWNPATTKLWPIRPSPPFVDVSDMDMLFSFWIDPSTNEFKIFWIVDGPRFLMYTSCNDSWKELKAPLYPGDSVTPRQCCSYSVSNGIYYFLKYNGTTHHTIIAYDIFKDLFQEIRMPKIEINSKREIKLDLLGDSLALFVYENVNFEARTEVWVMKEKGCWTKLLNVDIRVDKPSDYQPLGFWKRNEVFVHCFTYDRPNMYELMIYDTISGKARKILVETGEDVCGGGFYPLCYKETLISIKTKDNTKVDGL